MSFLGSIGNVVKNSWILQLFLAIYTEKPVKKMLDGKSNESTWNFNSFDSFEKVNFQIDRS